jgi:hypothetical protein
VSGLFRVEKATGAIVHVTRAYDYDADHRSRCISVKFESADGIDGQLLRGLELGKLIWAGRQPSRYDIAHGASPDAPPERRPPGRPRRPIVGYAAPPSFTSWAT